MNAEEILKKIRKLCQSNHYTLYSLSKKSGVPLSTLSGLYARNSFPSIPTLIRLCEAFDITLGDFFTENPPTASLTEKELLFLKKVRLLTTVKRQYLNAYIDALLSGQQS